MHEHEIQEIADPAVYLEEVKRRREGAPPAGHGHRGPIETVREDHYRGRHIVVRTTYEIAVDGRPVTGHLNVGNDGRVHYHAVPNLSFASAIDLVRQLIDTFPEDFRPQGAHHQHGEEA